MSLLKQKSKVWLIVSIVFLVLCAVGVWYFFFFNKQTKETSALKAIPQNAAIVIDIQHITDFNSKLVNKKFEKEIKLLPLLEEVNEDLENLGEFLSNWGDKTFDLELIAASQLVASDNIDWLYAIELDNVRELEHQLVDFPKVIATEWNKHSIYTYTLNDEVQYKISFAGNLVLISRSQIVIENGIYTFERNNGIKVNTRFDEVRKLTGKNSDATFYFNIELLTASITVLSDLNAQESIKKFSTLGEWFGVDVWFEEASLKMNGYLLPRADNQFFAALQEQELPEELYLADVLPDNTAVLTHLGLSDINKFYNDLNSELKVDFGQYFLPWMGNEVAYVITDPRGENFKEDYFAVFKAKDVELAKALLKDYAAIAGTLKERQYRMYDIRQFVADDILTPIFGNQFSPIQNPYYTIINDFVVFANSENALRSWLDKQLFGQTLGRDAQYLKFYANLATTSNLYYYVNTSTINSILTSYFKDDYDFLLGEYFFNLQKFTPVGLQFTPHQNKFFTTAFVEFHPAGRPVSSILWKTELKEEVATVPSIVKNHTNDELEVLVQDVKNRIYLINKNGEILWGNEEIDSTIISDIYQIDYYNNTFLQYFFNTKKYLYLIDRNGNHVDGFPRRISPNATNGMLVVDYFNNKEYRYFLGLEDGAIRGYDKEGFILEGWNKENLGTFSFPIQHFMYQGKDYLVALSDEGELFSFKRNGENRLDSLQFKTTFPTTFSYDTLINPRIVATNENGKAYVTNFRGKFFNLGMNVGENKDVKFVYTNIIGDERKDYVVLSENELGVFYYEKDDFRRKFRYKFDENQDELFSVNLNGHQHSYIATLSKEMQRIYMINEEGGLYPDFPLAGTTPFIISDLYQDGKSILVGGNQKEVYAYKLKDAP